MPSFYNGDSLFKDRESLVPFFLTRARAVIGMVRVGGRSGDVLIARVAGQTREVLFRIEDALSPGRLPPPGQLEGGALAAPSHRGPSGPAGRPSKWLMS